MKKLALILTVLSSLAFVPTDALAKDKRKKCENESEKQARLEADRRANGYYTPRYYGYDRNCDQDRRNRGYDDRRSWAPRSYSYRGY